MGRKIFLVLALIMPGGLLALAFAWAEERYDLGERFLRFFRKRSLLPAPRSNG